MTLHLVYRLYGGENRKGRPTFYSKRSSLASFLLAAEVANADIVVLADGPLPADLRAIAEARGQVVDLANGPVGMRGSYRAALALPQQRGWSDDDIVYFCEDDYLHDPNAFVALEEAASNIPAAGYFALYASTPEHPAFGPHVPFSAPKDWIQRPSAEVQGRRWVNVPSTASTFGARVGTLRADLGIFRQGMVPYPSRLLDHETCLVYQGRFPYSASEMFLGPPDTRFRTGATAIAANTVLTPFRVAYQMRSLTRRRHPHLLYAADPNLACHMETEFMSPGVDWRSLATAAEDWLARSVPSFDSERPDY
ncbi:hypothetical protein ACVBEQ_11355 [Nakamurella sp. GG22]